jgi:predicted AlkP superfamily pyrophosphatase or phosphodiesterase
MLKPLSIWSCRIILVMFIFFTNINFISAQKTETAQRKVVLVILDGIPAHFLENTATPKLDEIAERGGYARAWLGGEKGNYSETPTISAVGYNSMLTGTWVNKHNVKDNRIQLPNYHYWSIFRYFKEVYPQKSIAVYSTWLDNRTKLLGENLAETGYLQIDFHFDGLELDTIRFPHDDKSLYVHRIDNLVASYAAQDIHQKAPDLTWVYLQYTDDIGHKYGNSTEMEYAVKEADRQVGELWEAIKYRQDTFNEEFLLLVTTDHGRATGGFHHGGQTEEERGIWMVSSRPLNQRFGQNPAIVDVFPTVASYLDIPISKNHAMELDGVDMWNAAYASDLKASGQDNQLHLNWKTYEEGGEGIVWITFGNQFRYGNVDQYTYLGKVDLREGNAVLDLAGYEFRNAKVVLEMPKGFLNYWISRP